MFYQKVVKYFLLFIIIFLTISSLPIKAEIIIENEWARVMPNGSGAAYMKILSSSDLEDKLISASSDKAKMVMIHRSVRDGDISKMIHIHDGIEIPGNSSISLKPGDYHLMLMNIDNTFSLGDKINIKLNFEKQGIVEIFPITKLRPPMMHKHE